MMTWRVAMVWYVALAAVQVHAQTAVVAPEFWDRPRDARAVLGEPAVRRAVESYLAQPGAYIVIRHAPSAAATLEAEELRSWLVALAVEPQRISLSGDLRPGAQLVIEAGSAR